MPIYTQVTTKLAEWALLEPFATMLPGRGKTTPGFKVGMLSRAAC